MVIDLNRDSGIERNHERRVPVDPETVAGLVQCLNEEASIDWVGRIRGVVVVHAFTEGLLSFKRTLGHQRSRTRSLDIKLAYRVEVGAGFSAHLEKAFSVLPAWTGAREGETAAIGIKEQAFRRSDAAHRINRDGTEGLERLSLEMTAHQPLESWQRAFIPVEIGSKVNLDQVRSLVYVSRWRRFACELGGVLQILGNKQVIAFLETFGRTFDVRIPSVEMLGRDLRVRYSAEVIFQGTFTEVVR